MRRGVEGDPPLSGSPHRRDVSGHTFVGPAKPALGRAAGARTSQPSCAEMRRAASITAAP